MNYKFDLLVCNIWNSTLFGTIAFVVVMEFPSVCQCMIKIKNFEIYYRA